MGKRSSFPNLQPKDYWPTPRSAVEPLLPHLQPGTRFIEPCAGDGRLIRHLQYFGHVCVGAYDIEPRHEGIRRVDARHLRSMGVPMFITNLPWSRPLFHAILDNLARQAPLWTIVDAGWLFTVQAAEYMPMLRKVVAIGRVQWIEDSPSTGKDDSVWILADATRPRTVCEFHGR